MDIIVSSPGSPGTSFTQNVKRIFVRIFDELQTNPDFSSLSDLKSHLNNRGIGNANYIRNILPFVQFCGFVKYQDISVFENKYFFTDFGYAYIDALKCLEALTVLPASEERTFAIQKIGTIEQILYFHGLVNMMKNKSCNYALDFYDVLRFVKKYESINPKEYMLLLYMRDQNPENYLDAVSDLVQKLRGEEIEIHVKARGRDYSGGGGEEIESVNSFPYVCGNFEKAGIFRKDADRDFFNQSRLFEINQAMSEVSSIWSR